MNKKLVRNIIIAVVVIAVLGAAYFFAMKWEPQSEDDTTDSVGTAKENVVVALSLDEIKSIEINNSKGNIKIVKDGINYSVQGYDDANLAVARLTGPFVKLEKIVAEREITGDINPDEYGFASPRSTVNITKTDGEKVSIVIGNADPTAFGYYVKTNISDSVYLVEEQRLETFFAGIDEYKNKHIADISFENLESFEIYKGSEKVTSVRKRNSSDTLTDIVIENLIMTYPYYEYISLQELAVPFEGLESVDAIEEVSASVADADSYGIGAYTIKIKDSYGNLVLKLGNKSPDGNVYAVCEGTNAIYTINGAWLETLENFVPFDYLYKLTNVYMIDDVASVSFACPDGEYTLSKDNGKYFVNGETVDEEVYKDIYTAFVSMSFTGDGKNIKPGKEIGRLTFRFNDGSEASSVYYEADDRNYLVVKQDGAKYLVLKKNFDPVYETVSGILK